MGMVSLKNRAFFSCFKVHVLCLSGKPAYNQAAESGKVLAGEAGLLFQGVADRL
jgi:hypothetical protein